MAEGTPEPSRDHGKESLTKKARDAGLSLKELVNSIGRKSRVVVEQKTVELKESATDDKLHAKDAMDIQMLGSHIESLINIFEDTMDRIAEHPSYDEQHKMLVGFKKILEEEANVINARLSMARRLKRLEPSHYSETIEERIDERTTINTIDTEVVSTPLPDRDEPRTMAEMVEEDDKDKT
jgi:hypothetical protein